MQTTNHVMLIFAAVVLVMIIGGGLIYAVQPYSYDSGIERTQDGMDFRIDSSVSADYNVVVLDNGDRFDVEQVYAYYDEDYQDFNKKRNQSDFISIFGDEMSIRGFDNINTMTANELLAVISDDSMNPESVAIMMCSGSFPITLYDGTEDSPIIEWMKDGGTLIWIGGPIGAYYSDGHELIAVDSGYEELFFGPGSYGMIRDTGPRLYIAGGQDIPEIEEAFDIVINDATYGIDEKILRGTGLGYLPLGYLSDTGFRCAALTEVAGGQGTIVLLGCELNQFYAEAMAQCVVSGLNPDSKLIAYEHGSMKSGAIEGHLEFSGGGNLTVVINLEKIKVIYSRSFTTDSLFV